MKRELIDYEKEWSEFWRSLVTKEDGSIDLEQIKKELSDYSFILEEVPKVYSHIANLSYPNYYAQDIISEADEKYRRLHGDMIRDDIGEIIDDENMDSDEKLKEIREYIESY